MKSLLAKKIPANRAAIIIALSFVVVAALYLIPTELFVMSSGTVVSVTQAVQAEERVNTGDILLAPVAFYARTYTPPGVLHLDASPVMLIRAGIDRNAQVSPLKDLVGDATPREYLRQQQATQIHAQFVPLVVALEHANKSYDLRTDGVRVTSVSQGAPADGVLFEGDIIVYARDRDVRFVEHVIAVVSQSNNTPVLMTVVRDGEHINVTVPVENGRAGVRVQNHNLSLDHDTPVSVDLGDLFGSSADVLIALEVYSVVTQTDLTQGRTISGSGSLGLDGTVRGVRGVALKAQIAKKAGATIFFMPADDETVVDIDGLEVVRVSTFADVLEYLRE